ncbi:hypothetical protein F9U64_01145 [Gracilibacillus oryzae]|uniref:Phage protein Gp138 N-terminal domain-containing protein n=1 Tax=Gracilibacillus oryzae TaxID=1672701 RepID=A0A7C8KSS8_9BACI|nr:Gp138 family membrane-puncturing spike protein [Gracilibacillus oryzae]KAB8139259.1 hypothetical protein F9U64_01145 [Gracilibacillus oryzae]
MNEKSNFNQFIQGMIGDGINGMHTAAIARIENYDPSLMKADITIMQTGDEVFDVPVSYFHTKDFIIRPPYQKGDLVTVIFAESSIDELITTGEQQEPRAKEKFSITDAIITQGVQTFQVPLPIGHENDLIIAKKDFTSKVVIKESGEVVIESDSNIYLGENATEGVPLGDQLKQWLDSHTHAYTWSDPGGNGVTSPPLNQSPAPSKKVKTE